MWKRRVRVIVVEGIRVGVRIPVSDELGLGLVLVERAT
jgi:hypothetical protein